MIFSSAPNDYLVHYGIKGQKWGIRRFQNSDGTLTAEGRERYGLNSIKFKGNMKKDLKSIKKRLNTAKRMMAYEIMDQDFEELQDNKSFKKDYEKLFDSQTGKWGSYKQTWDEDFEKLIRTKYPKYEDVSKMIVPWDVPDYSSQQWLWDSYHPEDFSDIPNNYYNRASTLLAKETADIKDEALKRYGETFVNKLNLKVDKMYEY